MGFPAPTRTLQSLSKGCRHLFRRASSLCAQFSPSLLSLVSIESAAHVRTHASSLSQLSPLKFVRSPIQSVSFTTNNDETSWHRFANLTLERVIYTIDRRKFFCETSYLLVQCSTFSFTMMISITTNCCAVVCELKRKCDARYNIHARARTRPRAPIVPRFSFLFILSWITIIRCCCIQYKRKIAFIVFRLGWSDPLDLEQA